MFARFTYLYINEDKQPEAKAVYNSEIAPVIRKHKGNKQMLLLEAPGGSNEFISYSLWEEENIKAFEASDDYPPVIARIKELVFQPPVQKYCLVNSWFYPAYLFFDVTALSS